MKLLTQNRNGNSSPLTEEEPVIKKKPSEELLKLKKKQELRINPKKELPNEGSRTFNICRKGNA